MSLQVFVNGLELVNGPIHRLNIRETTGLWDPAALVEPGTVETFEGPFRVRQTTVDYGVREITIVGSLYIASVSYADKLRALDWLQSIYAPRPSRVVVGSLELLVDFGRVQIQADELKRLTGTIRYQITGTAVPATFSSSVSAGTGYAQALAIDTAAINESATTVSMSSGVGTVTVLGDAPTPAVVTIKGANSTTYYLATSATGRRVPITTDANGMGRIDERAGFYLAPGRNVITAYAAATGTTTLTTITVMSLFGTTWRFTGNAAAGSITRFDLGPVLTTSRSLNTSTVATTSTMATNTYWDGTTILTAGTDEPRIGYPAVTGGSPGLVVEGESRNICLYSEDFSNAAWVKGAGGVTSNAVVAPDGATTGDRLLFSSPFDASAYQIITGLSSSATQYTWSVWVKAVTGTVAITQQVQTVSAGAPTGTDVFADVVTTVGTTWTRIVQSGSNANTSIALLLSAPASFDVWGSQLETGWVPTSYMPTVASPTNRLGDMAGVVVPHNLILYSEPVSQGTINTTSSPWLVTGWSASTTPVAGPLAGLLNATTITTTGAAGENIRQAITPSGTVASRVFTFSVWLRQAATTASVQIRLENQAGTTIGSAVTCRTDSTWRRYHVTATTGSTDTGIVAKILTANAGGSIEVFGAQVTEGHLPGRYVRNTDTRVENQPVVDSGWQQNGYIESTLNWYFFSGQTLYMLGDPGSTTAGNIRFDTNGGGANTFRFLRYHAAGSASSVSFTDATAVAANTGRIRLEWQNYTLAGTRYVYLRIHTISGGVATLRATSANLASTVTGMWPAIDLSRLVKHRNTTGELCVISDFTIGTAELPQGAVPAGI
jgi:hypothetical protein